MACCFKENPSTSLCEEGLHSPHSGSAYGQVNAYLVLGAFNDIHTKEANFAARTEKDEMVGVSILLLLTIL